MQLSFLAGAAIIATCIIQIQTSNNLKEKKTSPLSNSMSISSGPEKDALKLNSSSSSITDNLPIENQFESMDMQSSNSQSLPSKDSSVNQNVQSNDNEKKPSTTLPRSNTEIVVKVQEHIDALKHQIKEEKKIFEEVKQRYNKSTKEVEKEAGKLKTYEDFLFSGKELKTTFSTYMMESENMNKGILALQTLRWERVTAISYKLIKEKEISNLNGFTTEQLNHAGKIIKYQTKSKECYVKRIEAIRRNHDKISKMYNDLTIPPNGILPKKDNK